MRHVLTFLVLLAACATDSDGDGYSQECDDDDPTVFPDAAELCDGIDNNCDGRIDDGWLDDADGDQYGGASLTDCAAATDVASGDCLDTDASVHPGAGEQCDGVDDDCNEAIDDGLATVTYWPDADGDGYGSTNEATPLCGPLAGYVTNSGDCDDTAASVHVGHVEDCDVVDNDCDGVIDNHPEGGYLARTSWPDADDDGAGDSSAEPTIECYLPDGHVTNDIDCDDSDPSVPIASELCSDGKDNDCNGESDLDDEACQ